MKPYVFLLLFFLSGCATLGFDARLDITQDCSGSYRCKYFATLENTGTIMLPGSTHVTALVLDCDGNTLDEDDFWFDDILVGKKQTKRIHISDLDSEADLRRVIFYIKFAPLGIAKNTYSFC